jgi:two-component system sensor histidine kinase and response regulator WspE
MSHQDLSDMSMMDLFRLDAESQVQALDAGLLALERDNQCASQLESCMRASHSLKGAAVVIGLMAGVEVAHAMEDCFVAAQRGKLILGQAQIDVLLQGADLLRRISQTDEAQLGEWTDGRRLEIDVFLNALREMVAAGIAAPARVPAAVVEARPQEFSQPLVEPAAVAQVTPPAPSPVVAAAPAAPVAPAPVQVSPVPAASAASHVPSQVQAAASPAPGAESGETGDRVLRVTAENLNRLLGLAG